MVREERLKSKVRDDAVEKTALVTYLVSQYQEDPKFLEHSTLGDHFKMKDATHS